MTGTNSLIDSRTQFKLFDDARGAYSHKSDWQLFKTYCLFKIIQSNSVAKIITKITLVAVKLGMPITSLIRQTVFKQFCGGETLTGCDTAVFGLGKDNIGSILDYSAEGKQNEEDFDRTTNEVCNIIQYASKNRNVPYTSIKVTGIVRSELLKKLGRRERLNKEELNEFIKFKNRLDGLCRKAHVLDVPINIDAEESWVQEPIDDLTYSMMKKYNKEKAIVSITLQMYRVDRLSYLDWLLEATKNDTIFLGIKIVRGAYWKKEKDCAIANSQEHVVYNSKEQTDEAFNKAIQTCVENINRVVLCVATHNEESTSFLMQCMKDRNIKSNHPNISFAQLYGMSDHISYKLAKHDYNVAKYLPYGPIKSVMPYLVRRAEENSSMQGQMGRELDRIIQERKRRKYSN